MTERLGEMIIPQTTGEQFEEVIGKLITPEDREVLGPKAIEKVLYSLLILSVYSNETETTFELDSPGIMTSDDFGHSVTPQEADAVINVLVRAGFFSRVVDTNRLKIVDTYCQQTILHLFEQNESRWSKINYGE